MRAFGACACACACVRSCPQLTARYSVTKYKLGSMLRDSTSAVADGLNAGSIVQRRNKTESLSIIVNRDAQKSLSERGTIEGSEGRYRLRCFQSDGEFNPDHRSSDRESTLVQVKFSFINNKYDLS